MASLNLKDLYLRIIYWFVSNKKEFKKWWIIAITVVDLLVLIYVAFSIFLYSLESPKYNKIIASLSHNFISTQFKTESQPKEIIKEEAVAIPIAQDEYDLVVKIKNSNEDWGLKNFKYRFVLDEVEQAENTSFILPDQEKYLFQQGVSYSRSDKKSIQKIVLKLYDLEWQRISDKTVINNLSFEASDIKLTSSVLTNTNQPGSASHMTAKVRNKSIYGFWEVGVPVTLIFNNKVVGINYTVLRQLESFEERPIDFSWFYGIPENSEVLIQPEVNIFDSQNFM